MTSSKPYLLRALYDWVLDNNLTPYVLVNAEYPNVRVPPAYVEEGKIILNLAPLAVTGFAMNNECLEFKASFGGRLTHLYVPMASVLAIYAFENGRGLFFGSEDEIINEITEGNTGEDNPPPEGSGGDGGDGAPKRPKGPPKLTVVK